VLQVIYLVFNEGYSASAGASLTRTDLSGEAIRLGRLLVELLPEPEVKGLLGLMLLHEARRPARTNAEGDLVLLEQQDRSLWDQAAIAEALQYVNEAMAAERPGRYSLQAAIAAAHTLASSSAATDWGRIVGLYNQLVAVDPSPVAQLNRAVAVAMHDGPAVGLDLLEAILARGELGDYQPAYAVQAELNRRAGRIAQARAAYERALSLSEQEPERRFLARRLAELPPG
jgi:RNA polymerase sigma-70 factor (ECF subfamily)